MATIIYRDEAARVDGATVVDDDVWLPAAELSRATGWELKPEGVCAADTCVPLPAGRQWAWLDDGRFNLSAFARHLGQACATDVARGVWVFGEAAGARPGGTSPEGTRAEAPDFTLPDVTGRLHSLSDHRGRKVLLLAWASW